MEENRNNISQFFLQKLVCLFLFHFRAKECWGQRKIVEKSSTTLGCWTKNAEHVWLLSGLPDFSLFGFAQGLAPSMVRASALRNRGWKLLPVFLVGRRRASLERRFVDYRLDSSQTLKIIQYLLSGLPDFSLSSFAQGLAPSMVRASDLRNGT